MKVNIKLVIGGTITLILIILGAIYIPQLIHDKQTSNTTFHTMPPTKTPENIYKIDEKQTAICRTQYPNELKAFGVKPFKSTDNNCYTCGPNEVAMYDPEHGAICTQYNYKPALPDTNNQKLTCKSYENNGKNSSNLIAPYQYQNSFVPGQNYPYMCDIVPANAFNRPYRKATVLGVPIKPSDLNQKNIFQ